MYIVSKKRRFAAFVMRHFCAIIFVIAVVIAICSILGYALSVTPQIPVTSGRFGGLDTRRLWNETDGLFWFSHISDLHLSDFFPEPERYLTEFCNSTFPTVQPDFVIASGDLTDGFRSNSLLNPGQREVCYHHTVSALKRIVPDST